VGIIGLGAGVLASYGRKGDELTFYEISPLRCRHSERRVHVPARTAPQKFSGAGRRPPEPRDAAAPQAFDILGIDAFAGDSIPMHLVTREAMALYVRHPGANGVIVFQATNRYIDLMPVVKRLANEFSMNAVLVSDVPGFKTGREYWLSGPIRFLSRAISSYCALGSLGYVATPIEDRPICRHFTDCPPQHVSGA
jgi:hypothetical protein